jgi:hypothetical protein
MNWAWDDAKNRANRQKHGISFEVAQKVFIDPFVVSRIDTSANEERWQSMGMVGTVTIMVVHTTETDPATGCEFGRIISARKATSHERKAYEEGQF